MGLNFLFIQSLLPTFWNSKLENHGSPRARGHEIYKKIFVFALPIPGVFNLRLYKSKDCHNTEYILIFFERRENRKKGIFVCFLDWKGCTNTFELHDFNLDHFYPSILLVLD